MQYIDTDLIYEGWGYVTEDEYKGEMNELFEELKGDGYVWRDRGGKDYKLNDIKDSHLLNILNFCKRTYRPEEQVNILKNEAVKRGLMKETD